MSTITPSPEAISKFLAQADEGPVVMINLLKFRAKAQGEEGTGAEAYARYGAAVTKMVAEQGGRIVWSGRPEQVLVGSPTDEWDAVVLVEYPRRRVLFEMSLKPEYQKIHAHREAGLERTALIACTPIVNMQAEMKKK